MRVGPPRVLRGTLTPLGGPPHRALLQHWHACEGHSRVRVLLPARGSARVVTFPQRKGKGRRPADRTPKRHTAWVQCLVGGQTAVGWAGRGGSGARSCTACVAWDAHAACGDRLHKDRRTMP